MSQKPSKETQSEAAKIANATQRPGQTKEQTKLIIQGIEKGIAEYKKQEKAKARERDKQRKKDQRQQAEPEKTEPSPVRQTRTGAGWLPWSLLVISWLAFGIYLLVMRQPG